MTDTEYSKTENTKKAAAHGRCVDGTYQKTRGSHGADDWTRTDDKERYAPEHDEE